MKIKTSELIGPALDWAVGVVEGYGDITPALLVKHYKPSTDWAVGGPLVSKYHMDLCCEHPETIGAALCDENGMYIDERMMFGNTHLIAACRAIVAARIGDEVDVPEELL